MTTLALFNNKGGVGKTTLTFHLAHMLAKQGQNVLAVDLDPQANLTAAFLEQDVLEVLWRDRATLPGDVLGKDRPTLFPRQPIPDRVGTIGDAVRELEEREGGLRFFDPFKIIERLYLVPGDLSLSSFEDTLAKEWSGALNGDRGSLTVTAAFHRIIRHAVLSTEADITLIDVGPNLGAINRSALLAADKVLMPLAADLFSLRGLSNLGPKFRQWRHDWGRRSPPRGALRSDSVPDGLMEPLGYVVMQPQMRGNRPVKAYDPWLDKIPVVFAEAVLGMDRPSRFDRPHQVGSVRHYGGLMSIAHRVNKPGFDLRSAEGASSDAVNACEQDFDDLARAIADRLDP